MVATDGTVLETQSANSATAAKTVDEVVLWENFKKGNELAFSILYKRYVQPLYNYGMHACKDKELVLDCLQELFAYLWDRRETVSAVGSVQFYLYKSYRRLLIGKVVAARKFSFRLPSSSDFFEFIPSFEQSIIEDEVKMHQQEWLKNGIRSLSKKQREALFLKFFNELSYHEVASIMDIRVESVYNLISKSIDILRRKLKR
jgi:RNA polymerase sigma factor (sigma-70 family)